MWQKSESTILFPLHQTVTLQLFFLNPRTIWNLPICIRFFFGLVTPIF